MTTTYGYTICVRNSLMVNVLKGVTGISDRERQQVTESNRLLAQIFGVYGGHPIYQWVRLSQIKLYKTDGMITRANPATGVIAVVNKIVSYTMADNFGADSWVLGMYKLPDYDEATHHRLFDGQIPYGAGYQAVGSTVMALGDVPDKEFTTALIKQIYLQRGLSLADIAALDKEKAEQHRKAQVSRAEDMMLDKMTAFAAKPGSLQDVSFQPKVVMPGTDPAIHGDTKPQQ